MENNNTEQEIYAYKLREELINELVDSYKERYNMEVRVDEVVSDLAGSVIVFNMISSDNLKFKVMVDITKEDESAVTDDYVQAKCRRQMEDYLNILIPGTYTNVDFIEEFEPESSVGITFDDYIVKHNVSDVIIRIFAEEGSIKDEMIDTVHQVLCKNVKIPVTYLVYFYGADNYKSAVEELKSYFRLTKYAVSTTNPSSVKTYSKEEGEN